MATIETLYHCRIDYSGEGQDEVMNRAFTYSYRDPAVEIEAFDGCPACVPYILLVSPNRKAVERLAGKIERYINRRKDVELEA